MPDDTNSGDDPKPAELPPTERSPSTATRRVRIGPYRLLEKLGEGGMGEVWLAEQLEPVKRKVALKVIKKGMDTEQVVARFEAERQALAMMDHPAIAKVYDAGATPQGRPYFVMEHVKGVRITEHCDRQKLTTKQRLQLFAHVCEGVQHAHQKAVIHRDLKPANIIVSVQDGRAKPKIIDFGVAKATAQSLTEKTMHTQLGMMIGTPAYMSPEQAELTGQDIDTRTDVYALGVILYELLVGALPFERKDLQGAGVEAMVRKIREDEPPKPSTRLSTLGKHSTQSAMNRQSELFALKRELTGDLDWITLKCLEKDRTRRYGSAQELAADIERYFTNEPVLASPPSALYRARKFVRRHTGSVMAGVAGALVLIAFAGTMTVQAGRIEAQRDRANREAEAKAQVSEFLKNLFAVSDPSEARGNSITARELLDAGANKIEGLMEQQPQTAAELMGTIGEVYRKLGLYPQAEPLLVRALADSRRVLGDEHPQTLNAANNLGKLMHVQSRSGEATALFGENLEARKRVLGNEHPDTLRSMLNLAGAYLDQGLYAEAQSLYVETLDTQTRVLGDDYPDTLATMRGLALVYSAQGRHEEAAPLYVRALEATRRTLGDDHPDTLRSMNSVASQYTKQGRYGEAETLHRQTLESRRRVFGDDHPDTLESIHNLAQVYQNQARYDEAETLYRDSIESKRRVLGADHPDTLLSMNNLAIVYRMQDRYDEAETLYSQSLEARRRVLGVDHPDTLTSMNNLAVLYSAQGRNETAIQTLAPAVAVCAQNLDKEIDECPVLIHTLGELHLAAGDLDDAERYLRRALDLYEKRGGHRYLGLALEQLTGILARKGNRKDALDFLRRSLSGGYLDRRSLESPDLASLADDPEFEAIVAEVEKKLVVD